MPIKPPSTKAARALCALAACGLALAAAYHLATDRAPAPAGGAARPLPPRAQPARAQWFDRNLGAGEAAAPPGPGLAPAADAALYGRNGRVLDLGGLTVAQFVASRMAAARTGDTGAAYAVYQAISLCAVNDDPVADYHDPAERERFLRERAGLQRLCAGVSPVQVQERLRFLDAAARAGNADARVDFYMEGPAGGAQRDDPDDPAARQWRQDALAYLRGAAGQCDPFAMALLSSAYDAGQLLEHDPQMVLAYDVAAAAARHVERTALQLRRRYGEALGAAEVEAALAQGARLAAACPR